MASETQVIIFRHAQILTGHERIAWSADFPPRYVAAVYARKSLDLNRTNSDCDVGEPTQLLQSLFYILTTRR